MWEGLDKWNQKWKKIHYNRWCRDKKDREGPYTKRLGKPEQMDEFLKLHSVPKVNHEESQHLNRPVTSMERDSVFKNLPTTKKPRARWLHCWSLLNIKKKSFTWSQFLSNNSKNILISLKSLRVNYIWKIVSKLGDNQDHSKSFRRKK